MCTKPTIYLQYITLRERKGDSVYTHALTTGGDRELHCKFLPDYERRCAVSSGFLGMTTNYPANQSLISQLAQKYN